MAEDVNIGTRKTGTGDVLRRTVETAREAVLFVVWEQWHSLGSLATPVGKRRASSIVDPEALVLCSLILRDEERRLDDFLGWWAEEGASLLSVQRMLNLAERFPGQAGVRLGAFAGLAADAGHKRWRRHAVSTGETTGLLKPRGGKGSDGLDLVDSPTLMLRLRAGFGVGAKADLLTFLIGNGGAYASVREAAQAISYTGAAVRNAAQEMVLAQFIEETDSRPTEYAADVRLWAELLQFNKRSEHIPGTHDQAIGPPWRYWEHVLAFLTGILEWARIGAQEDWSPYILSSRARDLYARHKMAFKANRIHVPDPGDHRGTAYLSAFEVTVSRLRDWIGRNI